MSDPTEDLRAELARERLARQQAEAGAAEMREAIAVDLKSCTCEGKGHVRFEAEGVVMFDACRRVDCKRWRTALAADAGSALLSRHAAEVEQLAAQRDGMRGERDAEREIAQRWERRCEDTELERDAALVTLEESRRARERAQGDARHMGERFNEAVEARNEVRAEAEALKRRLKTADHFVADGYEVEPIFFGKEHETWTIVEASSGERIDVNDSDAWPTVDAAFAALGTYRKRDGEADE